MSSQYVLVQRYLKCWTWKKKREGSDLFCQACNCLDKWSEGSLEAIRLGCWLDLHKCWLNIRSSRNSRTVCSCLNIRLPVNSLDIWRNICSDTRV